MNEMVSTGAWVGIGVGAGALVVIVALVIGALVQIGRAVHLRQTVRTNWVLAVILAPVFGAIAWFAVGNRVRLN